MRVTHQFSRFPILLLSRGCLVGDEDLNIRHWGEDSRRTCSAVTVGNCECYSIKFKDLYGCFSKRSSIARYFIGQGRHKATLIEQQLARLQPAKDPLEDSVDSIMEDQRALRSLKLRPRRSAFFLRPVQLIECDYFGILDGRYE
jgi:hypothetical protein